MSPVLQRNSKKTFYALSVDGRLMQLYSRHIEIEVSKTEIINIPVKTAYCKECNDLCACLDGH